jgi:uncharacterized protein with GYD domain
MPYFCHQVSFTTGAWSRILQNTGDRFVAVRPPIESLGGKIIASFFALDSYDVLLLTDLPESVSIGVVDIALFSGGEVARVHSTRLLSSAERLGVDQDADVCADTPARAFAATT